MSSKPVASAEDFQDEIGASSAVVSDTGATSTASPLPKPNAFKELMKRKEPKSQSPTRKAPKQRTFVPGRDGLLVYTTDPEGFPPGRVVYYNEKFVVINDLFPKSAIHLLILPRDTKKNVLRPQVAFDDLAFLADCREEEKRVRGLVASELRRRYGESSASDKPRIAAMEFDEPPASLPPGRDWSKDVISGIHANPSMNHLHIHVLSRDMYSDCMKKRNHYLSFTTDFLVNLDQFPLAEDDHRRNYKHFPEDMYCWRCGKNFENRMTKLKDHLEREFEEWRRE